MTAADVALGLRLSAAAGWNQCEADWRRALALGAGFVAENDGRCVGTVAACRFGAVAWIALMLVEARERRKGVGQALMEHALAWLDAEGVTTVRLDATPLGTPLYEKLGFAPEYTLARYHGSPRCIAAAATAPLTAAQLDAAVALDRQATATDRAALLRRLFVEHPHAWRAASGGAARGYATSRPGANAVQVGPIVAVGEAGIVLLADALERCRAQPVLIDVPDANAAARSIVSAAGLTLQRPFVRMCRGPRLADRPEMLWACCGPEKG